MAETSKLHQINAQYSNTEDRVLLRTSTTNKEEYLVWLTRRFTKLLIDLLQQEIDKRGGTAALSAQKQTKQLFKQGAFEKPYAEQQELQRPLGDKGVVAYAIKSGTDKSGNMLLELRAEDGKGVTYNLNDALIYMFYSLLSQCVEHADWQLGLPGTRRSDTPIH